MFHLYQTENRNKRKYNGKRKERKEKTKKT